VGDVNGILSLEICTVSQFKSNSFLEVSFPSGYVFAWAKQTLSEENYFQKSETFHFYDSSANTHIIQVPNRKLLCWNILAYRMGNVYYDKSEPGRQQLFGWAAVRAREEYENSTLRYFFV